MSGGGDNGVVARVAGQVQPQTQPQTPASNGAAYAPIKQGPVYQPQYQAYQPQANAPQMQQMPNYQSGLQAAMMQMMQQYNRPMMRAPMQQGLQPSSALTYRPDMTGVTANLKRVVPSVQEQQRLQAIEDARIAAQDAANESPSFMYGGVGN